MRIPKGSRLNLNGYALQHDPQRHQDPETFWPERYEGDETTAMQSINSSDVQKRDHFAFGAGRRYISFFLLPFSLFHPNPFLGSRSKRKKKKSSQYRLTKNRRQNRICPGYNVAERSLAVAIMRILWAFEVTPSPDAKLPLNIADWRGDFPGLAGPTMPVMMLPRSKERVAVIDEAFAAAKMEREAIVS